LPQHATVSPRQGPRPTRGYPVAGTSHVLVALVLVLVPVLAMACPPDAVWIVGIYDGFDDDNALTLLGEQAASSAVVIGGIARPLWLSRTILLPERRAEQRSAMQPLFRGPPSSAYVGIIARALQTSPVPRSSPPRRVALAPLGNRFQQLSHGPATRSADDGPRPAIEWRDRDEHDVQVSPCSA
jgi:hypothetical protein